MELVNHSAVAASLQVGLLPGAAFRIGLVVAKATFRLTDHGPELDTQAPEPLLGEDRATPVGILPGELVPRTDPALELFVMGHAYPERGQASCSARRLSLRVGTERRELAVFGDRRWVAGRRGPRISEPEPFERMPLVPERAYGGSAEVEIDAGAFLTVSDQDNPQGRGFDPAPSSRALGEHVGAPPGFPRFDTQRYLPNLEDPTALIRDPGDAPPPLFWSAVPLATGLQAKRTIRQPPPGGEVVLELCDEALHRAHPTLVFAPPRPSLPIEVTGVDPRGRSLSFELPSLAPCIDYEVGPRRGTRALEPRALVLVPDEGRLLVVYRHAFTFVPGAPQTLRLRLEPSAAPAASEGSSW